MDGRDPRRRKRGASHAQLQGYIGLIQAPEADEDLRKLIAWCCFLTEVLLRHGEEMDAVT